MSIAVHQSVLTLITFGMNVENAKFSSCMYGRRFPRKQDALPCLVLNSEVVTAEAWEDFAYGS